MAIKIKEEFMDSVICTLFEGHYHYGLAALINSVLRYNFKGCIYVGYKGKLPDWALVNNTISTNYFPGSTSIYPTESVEVNFIPLTTNYHLTNFKPDFMLQLLSGPAVKTKRIFYFDPDIVLARDWPYFEDWVDAGIAVCEDINSPLPRFHPRRMGWRNYYQTFKIPLAFKDSIYVNGGFIGLKSTDFKFLEIWSGLQVLMGNVLGGLDKSSLPGNENAELGQLTDYEFFSKTDQDALNAAIEAYDCQYAFIGQEAMEFKIGGNVMSHALGSPKPWKKAFLMEALRGNKPSRPDRAYWNQVNSSIITYNKAELQYKRFCLNLATFICRFYHKN